MDAGGGLATWADRPAPPIALMYWRLPEGSTLRDVLLSVRADEVSGASVSLEQVEIAGWVMPRMGRMPFCPWGSAAASASLMS